MLRDLSTPVVVDCREAGLGAARDGRHRQVGACSGVRPLGAGAPGFPGRRLLVADVRRRRRASRAEPVASARRCAGRRCGGLFRHSSGNRSLDAAAGTAPLPADRRRSVAPRACRGLAQRRRAFCAATVHHAAQTSRSTSARRRKNYSFSPTRRRSSCWRAGRKSLRQTCPNPRAHWWRPAATCRWRWRWSVRPCEPTRTASKACSQACAPLTLGVLKRGLPNYPTP